MKYLGTKAIPLADIEQGKRLRPLNQAWVDALAESMAAGGQEQPIEVVEQLRGKSYRLVAGAHRVAAATALGWETIRAEIKTAPATRVEQLREIEENLIRYEHTALDRAVAIARRADILRELTGETRGRPKKSRDSSALKKTEIITAFSDFTPATVERIGLSERAVRRAKRIALISGPVKDLIHGTPLADKEGELYALSGFVPERQARIVEMILAERAGTVAEAAAILSKRAPADNTAYAVIVRRLTDNWKRGSKRAKRTFLDGLVKDGVITEYDAGKL